MGEISKWIGDAGKHAQRNKSYAEKHGLHLPRSTTGNVIRFARRRSVLGTAGVILLAAGLANIGDVVGWSRERLNAEGCESDYTEYLAEKSKQKPCELPVTSALSLGDAAGKQEVKEVAQLLLDTDTKTRTLPQDDEFRFLDIYMTSEATANYSSTQLAGPYPPGVFNGLFQFAVYNEYIRQGGEAAVLARTMCETDIANALRAVRSNPELFANDDFPASLIANTELVRHASEGDVSALQIRFLAPPDEKFLAAADGGLSSQAPVTISGSGENVRPLVCGAPA